MLSRVVSVLTGPLRLLSSPLAVVGPGDAGRRVGVCAGCLLSVFEEDEHEWHGGDVFHTDPCVAISPYATRSQ